MTPTKACPVVLHPDGTPLRFLIFKHPLAGLQIPKGTIEPNEHPDRAAVRELWEETGLTAISAVALGVSEVADRLWHFSLCRVRTPVRERWQHFCRDDGGHNLICQWHNANAALPDPFEQARQTIVEFLEGP